MIARFLPAMALIAVLLGWMPQPRAADAIEVTRAELAAEPDGRSWSLSADFYIPVSDRMREVLDLGVPLHFVVEFELQRARWYWSDQTVARASQQYKLSYHPITRRYRITQFGYPIEFIDLEEAINSLSRIRGWAVLQNVDLDPDTTYEAALRMRLDSSRLPGPLQIDALTNQDWKIEAPWKQLDLTPSTATSAR